MTALQRIVLVQSTYTPSGGAERVALSLIQGLLKRGVHTILLTRPGQHWPVADPALEVIPLGLGRGHRLLKAWAFNRAVNRYLDRHGVGCTLSLDKVTTFSHLHAGGGTHKTFIRIRNGYSNSAAALSRRCSPFHNYIMHLEKKGFENPFLEKVRCNSRMVKQDILNDYQVASEKLVVVHSGIRWQEMADVFSRRGSAARELCREHGLDFRRPAMLFLGSGFSRKGLDIAIRGLCAMPPDYCLVVVGKGSAEPYLRLAESLGAGGRVHFLGPQPKGWRFAALCRALVLPSHYDPFGGAAAEGHAMGIPVLVSDRTGYADWVVDGDNGVILKTPMTAEAIRKAFGQLADLIERPRWTAEQLREHARNVDDDVILDQLLTCFLPN